MLKTLSPQDALRYVGVNLPARDDIGARRDMSEVSELRNGCKGDLERRGSFAKAGKSSSFSPPL